MSFNEIESSKDQGAPIHLYLFQGAEPSLESMLKSVTIIPGTTQFGYGTTKVSKSNFPVNHIAGLPVTDFVASVDELIAVSPSLKHVSLVVAWHGTDLRCGSCQIKPKIEAAGDTFTPYEWAAGGIDRTTADLVTQIGGNPSLGGAPSDRSIYEAIVHLKSRGLNVTLYPFIMMDIPADNQLTNPYNSIVPLFSHVPNSEFNYATGELGGPNFQAVTFRCSVELPLTPADGVLFEAGGSTQGAWVGLRDGGTVFRVRAGSGASLPQANAAVLDVPVEQLPMDGLIHNIVWEFVPAFARVRLWVDGVLKGQAVAPSGMFQDNVWSGNDGDGYFLVGGAGGPVGEPNGTPWAWPTGASNLISYLGTFEEVEGAFSQPAYPWRGRITCTPAAGFAGTVDKTADAATQVEAFFGTVSPAQVGWNSSDLKTTYSGPAGEWSMRRFILTMARIADEAGVDDFLIGSEMRGVTQIRDNTGSFPAIAQFKSLASASRAILGADVRISYAADWSEYHSYRPDDGTGDVLFNMDPLWSDSNIDYIGVDNYLPLTDWRNSGAHLDRALGYTSEYDKGYMRDNIRAGEYFDWFYANSIARTNQLRSVIEDAAHSEHWVFRQKDFWNWWSQLHHNRPAGVRSVSPTDWIPQSKPFVFTEVGCPAVNLGANQPNVFIDAKSSESFLPFFSNGRPDAYVQRVYLETWLGELKPGGANNPVSSIYQGPMFDMDAASVWTWDARPFPEFPERDDIWTDSENWQRGHWITGRVAAGRSFDGGEIGPYRFTNSDGTAMRDGAEYEAWPITHGDVVSSGTLDKSDLEVKLARGTDLDDLFVAYPPSQVMNLFIFKGHAGLTPTLSNFPLEWAGRVRGVEYHENQLILNCEPVSTSLRRPGLRRNYQLSCPHVLYGAECRASKKAATSARTVSSVNNSEVTLSVALPGVQANYAGGLLEWQNDAGGKEIRTIISCSENMSTVRVRGILRDMAVGKPVQISFGCNRFVSDCRDLHDNILNYGGQPWIPLDNPFDFVSKFY